MEILLKSFWICGDNSSSSQGCLYRQQLAVHVRAVLYICEFCRQQLAVYVWTVRSMCELSRQRLAVYVWTVSPEELWALIHVWIGVMHRVWLHQSGACRYTDTGTITPHYHIHGFLGAYFTTVLGAEVIIVGLPTCTCKASKKYVTILSIVYFISKHV